MSPHIGTTAGMRYLTGCRLVRNERHYLGRDLPPAGGWEGL
jgi:hypothetical protein